MTDQREHPGDDDTGEHPVPRLSDSEALLRRVADIISSAKTMPLSSSAMINRDEILELLEEANNRLPEELRAARWLLRERDEFLAKTRREGDDILDAARAQAERMVQRTEVVRHGKRRREQPRRRSSAWPSRPSSCTSYLKADCPSTGETSRRSWRPSPSG